jgi:ATP-dependent Clp endopeptidase proteolytic subunit ClpP
MPRNTGSRTAKARNDALYDEFELRKLIAETEQEELKAARMKAAACKSRIYTFYGDVDPDTISECMAELGVWSREFPGQPLTVIFNSPGGYVDDGLALYDYLLHLRSLGHHLTTVTLGRAASMGAVLLQAGDKRVIGPNAFVMIHEVSAGLEGKLSSMSEDLRYYKRLQDKLVDILASRSKFTAASIKRRWHKKDWWLDADEAITHGFADEILSPEHMNNAPSEKAPRA